MKLKRLLEIIERGEGIEVEFKECRESLSREVFKSICAYLNTKGGHLFLGIADNGKITGIDKDRLESIKNDFVSSVNNPQRLNPTFYLVPEEYEYENNKFLYVYVPENSQVYKCNNRVYIRNADGDFDITDNQSILSQLYINKQTTYSENRIYPYVKITDLRQDLIEIVRKRARLLRAGHPWEKMTDLELLKSAQLYQQDFQTGTEGFTLAGVMLFGKDNVIRSIVPHHKTDAILRKVDLDRYDDRDYIDTNLLDSYDRLMAFCEKHLPDRFYQEDDQRISIRNHIFREVVGNILMHREYLNPFPAKLIIERGRVRTENSNKPHGRGAINPDNFSPFPKNPNICRMFKEIGLADELGSGVRKLFKYVKIYSKGKEPELIEEDIFKVIIPVSEISDNNITDQARDQESAQIGAQIGAQISAQKMSLIKILSKKDLNSNEIIIELDLKSRSGVLRNYIKPLLNDGYIECTIPEKKHSKFQKYRLTEKGKKLLQQLKMKNER